MSWNTNHFEKHDSFWVILIKGGRGRREEYTGPSGQGRAWKDLLPRASHPLLILLPMWTGRWAGRQ